MKKLILSLLLLSRAWAATSHDFISQHGITWTFDQAYSAGQFANGDWWVLGPITVTDITPRSVVTNAVVSGATLHGSMVNPSVGTSQGWDSRIQQNGYSSNLNVGLNLPLTVANGSSLMSARSYLTYGTGQHESRLQSIAVLTVLSSEPAAGAFRPHYVGSDKAIYWTTNDLDFSKLKSLSGVTGNASIATQVTRFERPWIEKNTSWTGRYIHPNDNQPDYGKDISRHLGEALLTLNMDYPNAEKELLLIQIVQYGLDVYGAAKNGGIWEDLGGHNHGRKMPMLFAGWMLGDTNILWWANRTNKHIFQCDRQFFYVSQADANREHAPHGSTEGTNVTLRAHMPASDTDGRQRDPYPDASVGLPEWGEQHTKQAIRDGSNYGVTYRHIVSCSLIGHVLAAQVMGLKDEWNNNSVFDYFDRYFSPGESLSGSETISDFIKDFWNTHRVAEGASLWTLGSGVYDPWSGLTGGGAPISIPSIPTNVQATASIGSIAITWTGGTNVDAYGIKRSTNNADFSVIGGSDATAFSDTSVVSGVTYYYRVNASNENGTSGDSASASATALSTSLPSYSNREGKRRR